MIAQSAMTFRTADQGTPPALGEAMAMRRTCAVQLFDRHTGAAHRVNGTPLVVYTRNPEAAVADLLERRDPKKWDVRVHEIEKQGAP